MKRMPLGQLLVLASLTSTFVGTVGGASLTFGEVAFSPGSTVKANVPLSAQEKSLAAQGGKVVGYVAPLLANSGCRVSGIYITGANEDHLSDGYTKIGPGAGFLNTPIYISAGRDDRIATVEQQYNVVGSIKRTGFQRVRIGTFHGGHEVNDAQTSIALRWFRELAR